MTKAEKTRQFIVERTAPVFNKKGFAGTSLTDITEATGLTKGSIYGNFANKDEVALAVFDYNFSRLSKGMDIAIAGCTSSVDALLKMTNFYRTEFKNTVTTGGCPILNTATEADDTHPELKQKVAKSIKDWKKTIENIIKKGISDGDIRSNINPSEYACEFIALIEGGIMLAKTTADISMLNTSLKRVETIIKTELKN